MNAVTDDEAESFERTYAAPHLRVDEDDPLLAQREEQEAQALAAPGEAYALRGCVLTPAERLDPGWVVVAGGVIAEVRDTAPSVRTVDTGGVVLPGLIDLHGHPEYNVFSAWEPPRLYANRFQWRRSAEYAAVVREPWRRMTEDDGAGGSLLPALTRYAEARVLVGGVTALQGGSGRYPDPHESLVRNVDRRVFGSHHGRSMIDVTRAEADDLRRLRDGMDRGEVRALYVHIAEGVDDESRAEFDTLVSAGLLTSATVLIHGTALTAQQLGDVRDAGAKLVWSPQSNLRLYGHTTDAARALSLGIPVGLGADWLPSGSPSLLDELQVARRVLRQQGSRVGVKRLVQAITSDAADIAALGEKLGRIRPGVPADLVVLQRHHEDPWESVTLSDRRSVELVTLGGAVAYGRVDWVDQLAGPTERELVLAWGKPMALDLVYSVIASPNDPPRLAELRATLLHRHPHTGPIFA